MKTLYWLSPKTGMIFEVSVNDEAVHLHIGGNCPACADQSEKQKIVWLSHKLKKYACGSFTEQSKAHDIPQGAFWIDEWADQTNVVYF